MDRQHSFEPEQRYANYNYSDPQRRQRQPYDDDDTYDIRYHPPAPEYQPPPLSPGGNPSAHTDSTFNRLRAARRYSQEHSNQPPYLAEGYNQPPQNILPAPPAPPHCDAEGRVWGTELGYTSHGTASNITPGADNYGESAAGGIAGIAMGVADANARESGVEAMRYTPGYDPRMEMRGGSGYPQDGSDMYEDSPYMRPQPRMEQSSSSLTPMGAAAFPPGMASPQARSIVTRSAHSSNQDPFNHEPYVDQPYERYSRNLDPSMVHFDPNTIEDDGDDGLDYRNGNNRSMLSLGHDSDKTNAAGAAGVGAGAAGVGVMGGLLGRKAVSGGTGNGQQYDLVSNPSPPNNFELGQEKEAWAKKSAASRKKRKWMVVAGVVILILVIAGAVVGGILGSQNGSSDSSKPQGTSASSDSASNGDLNKDSAEIKKLLGNTNLHKVFPGIDYTPMYTQYPDCVHYAPSQNNVTRDMAVLSQLTNVVRLYGTDCNQTEMVIHSIEQLGLKGKVKVWMGVWQDKNATTNKRQLEQMYSIFDKYGADPFIGVIVGNEVLFREDMTPAELKTVLTGVKTNLTAAGISLPLASSDLGDDWTAELANEVDYVMANIHPFFAGVDAQAAADWTWKFWQDHDVVLKADASKHIISETGWPSTGGTGCGGAATCVGGSVAGITQMNQFMESWVCEALANGTNYFWFEAFDEPWKIKFNEKGKEWEDKWGLMDVNRNLKPGVMIPDCGGKTVS
ncbi:related to glucan 1,3-beta-glucosidase precursor [Rhynchosporium secalis]|uniref:glucan endo-1,3-beta-D-glucosidase n=1 Tax=Rhynchosporium secalis TaxID=38038 RepID=A0A1E1MTR8_RHYSE|nr:related to glucan 1,3-beta-glucosidase precursor [Rhynchosporium secalis]